MKVRIMSQDSSTVAGRMPRSAQPRRKRASKKGSLASQSGLPSSLRSWSASSWLQPAISTATRRMSSWYTSTP